MAADEDRLQILRMVRGGQITTEEAAELLDALEEPAHLEERCGSLASSPVPAHDTNKRRSETSTNLLVKTLELGAKLARRANTGVWERMGDVK
jgi:hypothetical protein